MNFLNKSIFCLLVVKLYVINCSIITTLKPDSLSENLEDSSTSADTILPSPASESSSNLIVTTLKPGNFEDSSIDVSTSLPLPASSESGSSSLITTSKPADLSEKLEDSKVDVSTNLPSPASESNSSSQMSCLVALQARGFNTTVIPNETIKGKFYRTKLSQIVCLINIHNLIY